MSYSLSLSLSLNICTFSPISNETLLTIILLLLWYIATMNDHFDFENIILHINSRTWPFFRKSQFTIRYIFFVFELFGNKFTVVPWENAEMSDFIFH